VSRDAIASALDALRAERDQLDAAIAALEALNPDTAGLKKPATRATATKKGDNRAAVGTRNGKLAAHLAEIEKDWRAGVATPVIAAKFKCSSSAITLTARQKGWPKRPSGRGGAKVAMPKIRRIPRGVSGRPE
jgi:hypothetical protein